MTILKIRNKNYIIAGIIIISVIMIIGLILFLMKTDEKYQVQEATIMYIYEEAFGDKSEITLEEARKKIKEDLTFSISIFPDGVNAKVLVTMEKPPNIPKNLSGVLTNPKSRIFILTKYNNGWKVDFDARKEQ